MAAVRTKSQTVAALTSVLVSGCSFFPEQLLLPGEPMTDQGAAGRGAPRRSTMSSAVSSAGRAAAPTAPRSTPESSQAPAAGSGGSSPSSASPKDAGIEPRDASVPATSAGSNAIAAAGSGAAGASGEERPKGAQDPTCDLNGIWITKQLSASEALGEVGFSNSYAYYEIEQTGTDFVVKKHIDCGGIALGGGMAYLARATLEALTQHNSQSGRKGHFELVAGKCALDVENFWSVRGADEPRYLPDPARNATLSLAEMQAMKPLPTPSMPDGAEDWDNDGEPGIATQVSGIISGQRHGSQRDWDHWFTAPDYEITPSVEFTSDLTIRFEFEGEEGLLSPTVGLLATPSQPSNRLEPVMRFRFLGRTPDDPRVQAIAKSDPVETCYAIQDAIPAEQLTP